VRPRPTGDDSALERIRERLTTAQFSNRMVDRLVLDLDNHLSKNERTSAARVEQKALERLAAVIRTVPDIAPARGEIRAVMLIGPTGMGKTTSIAKLAARYFFYEKREVSLYSLDRYRLAATQQLRMYADVMKIPFFAPVSPQEFRDLTARDPGELLLIDTSGIGYRDAKRLDELAALAEACAVRLEKHLVLAANTERATIQPILDAYDRVGFDKILLTKLDESEFIGSFIELADKVNRPFSFLTNGQDVPADLIGPVPEDLAKMVLGKDSRG
jgi:flagellar biosynthesis protein FlhF